MKSNDDRQFKKTSVFCLVKNRFPSVCPGDIFSGTDAIYWSDGEGLKYNFIAEAWNENFLIDNNKKQFEQLHYTKPELGEAISLNGKLVSCSYRYL